MPDDPRASFSSGATRRNGRARPGRVASDQPMATDAQPAYRKPVGPKAMAIKYDLLTALGAFALSQGRARQGLVLRLITLLTARYNWARDELAVGQREIARLWHVDERTVKREMAKLRGLGWLVVKRQGARGRVSEYGLDIDQILRDTRPAWAAVGPDFEARLGADDRGGGDAPPAAPQDAAKIVPLHPVAGGVDHLSDNSEPGSDAPDPPPQSEWDLARTILYREDPGRYRAWIDGLTRQGRQGGRLILAAPSRFHASYVSTHLSHVILRACQAVDDGIDEISIG